MSWSRYIKTERRQTVVMLATLPCRICSFYARRYERNYRDPPGNLTHRVPPFKVTQVMGTGTERSATYDFLLMSHSNYGPISYRF